MGIDSIINVAILKRPINWITVILMVFIGSIAAHLVLSHYKTLIDPEPNS